MTFYENYLKGQVVLPRELLAHFAQIFDTSEDFLVWLYIYSNKDIAPSQIAKEIGSTLSAVNEIIQKLEKAHNLKITMLEISKNLESIFDASPAFARLDALIEAAKPPAQKEKGQDILQGLATAFEAELGTISPIQIEEIRDWLEKDHYAPALIREALKEAALNRKLSLNYIRAILRNWKNDGVRSLADVEDKRAEREASSRPEPEESFHIPTDGPWNQN